MDKKDFISGYLQPSASGLDWSYKHPLPDIAGLKKQGDFIIQCELEDTFSTNVLTRYVNETKRIKYTEVYKNTENRRSGVFVRLVGSLGLVKQGYPRVMLDAAIRNVSPLTGEKEGLTTRVAVHFPQADDEQRKRFTSVLLERGKKSGAAINARQVEYLPQFWGTFYLAEAKGVDLALIRHLRDTVWRAYRMVFTTTGEKALFDYRPFQQYMIYDTAVREHAVFMKMGLSVPSEAQAAFFAAMTW